MAITQTLGSSWTQNGQAMSQWNAQLTAGSEQVRSVQLAISGATLTQLWGLTRNDSTGLYGLPPYRVMAGGLGAGETHQFGYIWESSQQATITVSSIDCGSPAASPSPSASPVVVGSSAPSASPAASASASPAASGDCRLTVTQTKRPANDGGSWTTGDFGFQIYDLTLNNVGARAASNAVINVALNANAQQEIYQFWNIERQAADSSVFNVPTPWGAIQVGASQGAGYIVRYPLAAADNQVDPTVTVQSATCQGAAVSAAPSPAVSAAPSAAPSTIVSTPQPSSSSGDCKATVSIVARSAANSGAWQSNGASFQIFDLTIANAGSKPITGAELTFGLPSGTTVFQWWELTSRINSANVFDVAFNYGPLQVSATQGAGIVGKSSSDSQATPTVSIGSVTCA